MVIVILRIFFEGMIVTPCAADARTEKRLSNGITDLRFFRPLLLSHQGDIVANLGRGADVTGSGDHIASQLIPRPIGGDLRPQPAMEGTHPFSAAHVVIAFFAIL